MKTNKSEWLQVQDMKSYNARSNVRIICDEYSRFHHICGVLLYILGIAVVVVVVAVVVAMVALVAMLVVLLVMVVLDLGWFLSVVSCSPLVFSAWTSSSMQVSFPLRWQRNDVENVWTAWIKGLKYFQTLALASFCLFWWASTAAILRLSSKGRTDVISSVLCTGR